MMHDELTPYFESNYVTLSFSSSDYFIPYLTVTLHSLLENSDKNVNYDIFIFSRDATINNKNTFISFFQRENVSIRFVDVSPLFDKIELHTASHVTIETYFRLIVPKILNRFDKVLFLDSDLIINSDINVLFNLDITNYAIAATEECLFSAVANIYDSANTKKYVKEVLGLDNIDTYFQAGVLLFNVKKFNENSYSDILLDMVQKIDYKILDQDALNQLFADNYYCFDNEWNWSPMQSHMKALRYIENMSSKIREKYLSVSVPKIYHYADRNKPWLYPEEEHSTVWWSYARTTPFYELVLYRMSDNQKKISYDLHLPKLFLMSEYKSQKFVFKVLYKLSLGERRRRFKKKYLTARGNFRYCKLLLSNINSENYIK